MVYISKGMELKGSNEKRVRLHYFGGRYELNGEKAALWRRGRRNFATAHTRSEEQAVLELKKEGLVELAATPNARERYFLLTRCLLCVPKKRLFLFPLNAHDKRVLLWLRKAGFRLGLAELIYLMEHKVEPTKELLDRTNGAALFRRIHASYIVIGRHLEQKMSVAVCRDDVVETIVRLVRKKRIYLI